MFIRCRLRRLISFYKTTIFYLAILLLLLICFGLLKLFISFFDASLNSNCPYQEPIDVVYTWVNGSDPLFIQHLNQFLKHRNASVDSSKQRYDDKHELRFSLRSLEQFAPWASHVYIVTNGQIPYWLNLDYEKVSVVTHEEIFKDTYNLPTFSSPSIESNLHRIPGLSKRFVYFNDDVFLAARTHIDDFYAPNRGFLIYLAWPVPNCAHNCPWMYVSDGQCDKDCHRPECQMDGGDCDQSQMESALTVSLEDLQTMKVSTENLKEENETRDQYLAETVARVRTNFYNSFLKKLMTARSNISSEPTLLPALKAITNISDLVSEHNKKVLESNKLERRSKRKRRNAYSSLENLFMRMARKRVDAYSASLQHTNRMLNKKYGFQNRRVPSHAPIMIDKGIMEELQIAFVEEFAVTEKNKVRRGDDVQFSFSYYYFVISERIENSVEEVFDTFDTDLSGTWSDREIRTLLTKLYELPLSYAIVDHFEALLLNCSETGNLPEVSTPLYERYIDSKLPTISKSLVVECANLRDILRRFASSPRYRHEIISNSENAHVTFRMLNSNISDVVSNLDEIRSNRKKFVCLNDNLDESKESENELVRAVLYDFYASLFPLPSKFELPENYRNRFLYVKDLNEWKSYRQNVKLFLYCVIFVLVYLTVYNFFRKMCCQMLNKLFC